MSDLLRSNLTVATGTALSRVTGLMRIMVFGWVIGQTALSDAYLIANETPNIVYDLLLGGVLSATLVPLFSSFIETDDDEATNVVITISATLMVALTVVAVVAAPLIFRIYTLNPAADVDPELLRRVGTMLARIFLIQILFYGLSGLANAFLNSRRKFFAAAWSPIASNLIIIVTLLTLRDRAWQLGDVVTDGRLRWTLGLGATGGIAAMAIIVVVAAGRTGLPIPAFVELEASGRAQVAGAVGVDARLRGRQPGGVGLHPQPGRARFERCDSVFHRVHLLRVAARAAGRVDLDHVPARDVTGGRP